MLAVLGLAALFAWIGAELLAPPAGAIAPKPPGEPAPVAVADPGAADPGAARPAEADPTVRREAVPPPPADLPYTVTGVVLADPRARDLSALRVVAWRGRAGDSGGTIFNGMAGPSGLSQEPAFVLTGEPIADAALQPDGRFVLRSAERHLRLTVDHDLYVMPIPEIVHVPAASRTADVVLAPLLGGCLRGRLLGERAAEVGSVRLLLDADPMSVMRDTRLFLGAIAGIRRPAATPDADGCFVFRGVMTGCKLTLSATGKRAFGRTAQPPLEPGETRDVALAVRAAASLVVAVERQDGAPVERARVSIRPLQVTGLTAPQLATMYTTTGADGTCQFDSLAGERTRVEASAEGTTTETLDVDLLPGDEPARVRITLREGGVVTGTVVTPEGAPLADAGVGHQPSMDLPLIGDLGSQLGPDFLADLASGGVRSDAEGRFRLTGIADEGEFTVVASHRDYAAGVARGVRIGATGVRIAVSPLGALSGRAAAAEDGKPLDSFTVTLLRTAFLVLRMPVRQVTVADAADGAFALRGVSPGSYTLQITAEGRSEAQKDVDVKPGDLDAGTLQLPRAAAIAGTVRDEQGRPIAFAQVRRRLGAMADNPILAMFGGGSQQVHTDGEGRFRLAPLPPGRVQLLASAPGFATGRSERLQLAAGQQLDDLVIVLGHGGAIRGRLVVGPGQQADDYLLLVQEQATQATHTVDLAGDGTFTAKNLDPGQYNVQAMPQSLMRGFGGEVWRPGQALRLGDAMQKLADQVVSQRCAVRAGETTEVELDASDLGEGLRWTLRVEVGGRPLTDGIVEVVELAEQRLRGGILLQGSVTFGGMRPGAHRVQVRSGMTMAPIGPPQDVTLPSGRDSHSSTIALPGGELRGRVVDATSGDPLRHAVVRLLHAGRAEDDDPLGMALTDEAGEFRFPGLADGSYGLLAVDNVFAGREGTASRRDNVRVVSGQQSEPVELRALPAATASALVTDPSGAPIAGATVLCVDPDGHPLGALGIASTGPDGRAWFGGMPRGRARVVGRAPGRAPGASDVQEVANDRAVEFTLVLPSGARTVLQAFDRAGQPLAGAVLSARCNGGPWLPAMLLLEGRRADGGLELGRLGRGSWEFRVVHPSVGTLVQQRTIGDEASISVVIAPR